MGGLDKSRIAKSERNVAKGARAARLQHNRMVFDLTFNSPSLGILCCCCFIVLQFLGTGAETGCLFEREKGNKWINVSSPCYCE